MQIGGGLVQGLLHFFYAHELLTVFIALLIEEAGIPIPIPGDTLIMLAGAEPHKTVWSAVSVIVVCSLAVFLGSSALYSVMHHGGRPLLLKYGKYLRLTPRRLERLERWFVHRGRVTIILARFIPGLRIPTTVTAGISGIPAASYRVTVALAAPIWSLSVFLLGALIGREGPVILAFVVGILPDVPKWVLAIGVVLVLAGAGAGVWGLRRARARHLAWQ